MIRRRSRFIENTDPEESKFDKRHAMSDEGSKKPLVPDPKVGPRIEKDSDVRRRDQLYLLQDLFIKNCQPPKPKASPIRRQSLLLGLRKKAHNELQKAKGGRQLHTPLECTPDMDPTDTYKLKNSSQYSLYMRKDPRVPGPASQKSRSPEREPILERPETPHTESADIVEDYLHMTPVSPFKAPDLSDRETFKYWSKESSPKKPNITRGVEPLKTTVQTNTFFRKLSGHQYKSPKKPNRVGIRTSIAFRKSPSVNTELAKVDEGFTATPSNQDQTANADKPMPSRKSSLQQAISCTQESPNRIAELRDSETLANQGSPGSTISATVESARSASLIAAKASHVNILYAADAPKFPLPSPPPTAALPHPPTSQMSPVREHKKNGSFGYHPFPKTSPRGSPQKSPGKRTKFAKEALSQASAGEGMAKSGSAPLLNRTYGSPVQEVARKPSLEPSPIQDSPLLNTKQPSRMKGGDVTEFASVSQMNRQKKTEAKKRRDMAIHRAWLANADLEKLEDKQAVTGGQADHPYGELSSQARQACTEQISKDQDEIVHLPSIRDSYDNAPYINAQGVSGYQYTGATPEPLRLESPPTPPKTQQSNRKSRVVVLAEQPPLAIPVAPSSEDYNANIHPLHRQGAAAAQRRVSPLNPLAAPFVASHRSFKQHDFPNCHPSPKPAFVTSHPLRRDFSVRSAHSLPNDPHEYSPGDSFNSLVAENREVRLSAVEKAVERNSFLLEKVLVAALEENAVLKRRVGRKSTVGMEGMMGERMSYDNGEMGHPVGGASSNGTGLHGRDLDGGEDGEKAYL